MVTRPMFRKVSFYGLYDVILNGKWVIVPDAGYQESWGTFPKAEEAFAAIVWGATYEKGTAPKLYPLTALKLAIANVEMDLDFYLTKVPSGGKKIKNPYQGARCNPMVNYHAARIRTPGSIRKGTYRTKTIKHGIQLIIGKLKVTPLKKPKKGVGSRQRDATTVQAYRFPKKRFTPAQAKAWLKKYKIKYTLFEPARKAVPKKRKKVAPKRRRRAA